MVPWWNQSKVSTETYDLKTCRIRMFECLNFAYFQYRPFSTQIFEISGLSGSLKETIELDIHHFHFTFSQKVSYTMDYMVSKTNLLSIVICNCFSICSLQKGSNTESLFNCTARKLVFICLFAYTCTSIFICYL